MPGPRSLSPGWGVYGAHHRRGPATLSTGLDLLESSPSASSAVGALGISFMAAYLLAPAPVVPQGLVSLSPMGGDTAGQPFSALSSIRSGGSKAGGRSRSFHPASPSSRLVTHSSHPTTSRGDAHCRPDPDPCEQVFTWASSYGSGRVPFYGSPRRVPSLVGYGGRPGGQDAGSVVLSSSSYRCGGGSNYSDINTDHWGSSSSSYGRTPHLGGARTLPTSTQAIGVVLLWTPPHQIKSTFIHASRMLRWLFPLIPRIWRRLLFRRRSRPRFRLAPSPSPSTTSLYRRSRRRMIISPRGI
jgi:hypothetical protein